MNGVFLDEKEGRLALYLNGDLQFDSRDERLYHEPLARLPADLAAGRFPGRPLRVLILGGGDGLALREVLRVPSVAEVHLVDRDPEVLALGRGRLAGLNERAFEDPRSRVHCLDARDFLKTAAGFDVLIFDLTYPKDVEDSALFTRDFFSLARAALRPGGILAANAVSPTETPQAFGCIGATLESAGLKAVPYSFELPSFAAEGYGRWGFFYASTDAVEPGALGEGALFPAAAAKAMAAGANRTDELLFYINNPKPLAWDAPFQPLRFHAGTGEGPRLTAAQGFADWLRTPKGLRSLDELLRCIPLARRDQTRRVLLEWSHQAETLFREVDLKAFAEKLLREAKELPAAWRRELRRLLQRIEDGLPSLRELLQESYRVFAVFLLVLLLVNICFPDNLYAKGMSSHYGGSSGGSSSGSMSFSSYGRPSPFRSNYNPPRHLGQPRWSGQPGTQDPLARTFDWQGGEYPAQSIAVIGQDGVQKVESSVLALTKELQLLDSGNIAYVPAAGIRGYHVLLAPDRLRVLDLSGREALNLRIPAGLAGQVRDQIAAQRGPVDKAISQHRLWLGWVGWSKAIGAGQANAEMDALLAMSRSIEAARREWAAPARPWAVDERFAAWPEVFPGIRVEPGAASPARAAWADPDGFWSAHAVSTDREASGADGFVAQWIKPKPK